MKKRRLIFLLILMVLAAALRLYQSSFFEFKNDQFYAIELGKEARNSHFLITHGMTSGVGVDNPPLFILLMGIITVFTGNPFYITLCFCIVNITALIIAVRYLYSSLPENYAFFSSLILAFSPAFTMYSSNIWAQCLLPILMILFQISLYKFIIRSKPNEFIIMGIITALAGQLHMSGFSLFPVLIILAVMYMKLIGIKRILFTFFVIFIIYLPYLYHLIYENELTNFISFGSTADRSICWKIFREHIRIASFDFFRYYFRHDFNRVLTASVGIFKFILYPLSCALIAFYIFGFIAYLYWLIKTKKFFDTSETMLKNYPFAFQTAGFTTIVVTMGYLLFKIRTPPHYLIILFPCHSILAGFIVYRLWSFPLFKTISFASAISTAALLFSILLFLNKAGGHPNEYGPSYKLLLKCKNIIRGITPQGYCAQPLISCATNGKCDKEAMSAVIQNNNRNPSMPLFPVQLNISWDPALMRHRINIKRNDNPG